MERELDGATGRFRMLLGDYARVAPADVERTLDEDIGDVKEAVAEMKEQQLTLLQSGPRKRWLKEHRKFDATRRAWTRCSST